MDIIDYHELYIQEKSKVDELQDTIHRLNLNLNLNQYLNTVVLSLHDFEYCYDTNLTSTFKRCLNRYKSLPIKRYKKKVLIYDNDEWVTYTKDHSRKIWNNLHKKICKHLSEFDAINNKQQFECYVKKIFLCNIDVNQQHFFNYIKKNFI